MTEPMEEKPDATEEDKEVVFHLYEHYLSELKDMEYINDYTLNREGDELIITLKPKPAISKIDYQPLQGDLNDETSKDIP